MKSSQQDRLYSLTGIPRSALANGLVFENTVWGQLVTSEAAGGYDSADPGRRAEAGGEELEEEQEEPLDLRKTPNLVLTQGKNFLN
jgi:hypothetical protein